MVYVWFMQTNKQTKAYAAYFYDNWVSKAKEFAKLQHTLTKKKELTKSFTQRIHSSNNKAHFFLTKTKDLFQTPVSCNVFRYRLHVSHTNAESHTSVVAVQVCNVMLI